MDENKNGRRISVSSARDDVEEFTRTASSRRQSVAGGAGFTRLHKSIGRKLYEKFAAPAVVHSFPNVAVSGAASSMINHHSRLFARNPASRWDGADEPHPVVGHTQTHTLRHTNTHVYKHTFAHTCRQVAIWPLAR
jgi:hypothetical protein